MIFGTLNDRYPEAVKSSGAVRLQMAMSTSTWWEADRSRLPEPSADACTVGAARTCVWA